MVTEIDKIASASKNTGAIYTVGLRWVDHMAIKQHSKKSFLDLSSSDKIAILKTADPWDITGTSGTSPKKRRRINITNIFFETIKKHTFEAFYTNSSGWNTVGYNGPPQWSGNRDYFRCS